MAAPTRGARLLAWIRALPDHRLTDRLVRGRAWIVLVGFLLIGIVAMQVTLLKLNSGIGRAVAQTANLERRNGELRATVSRLSGEQRVQAMGAKLGLIAPDAGRVTYLAPRGPEDARAAAQALRSNQARSTPTSGSAQGDGPASVSGLPSAGDQTATTASPEAAAPPDRSVSTDSASARAGALGAPGR